MLDKLREVIDPNELLRRVIKYLVEGLMVAIAAYAIPKKTLNLDEVALIALLSKFFIAYRLKMDVIIKRYII